MLKQFIITISVFQLLFISAHRFNEEALLKPENVVFNFLFLFWLGMESARVRLGHKDKNTTYGFLSRTFLIVSFATVVIAILDNSGVLLHAEQYTLPGYFFYVGVFLLMIGVYIRHITIKQLGKFFVTKVQTLDNHELVTDGIYRVLRHPSYTGLMIGFIGSIIMLKSGVALAVFLLIGIPCYIYRIKVEESALINHFGNKYREYMKTTKGVLPFIY